jgi:hypothetical protein
MSFKAIAAAYGMIGAVAAAGIVTNHYSGDGIGAGAATATSVPAASTPAARKPANSIAVTLPPPAPWPEERWYAAVIPYDSRIHMPLGPEHGKRPVITWYRTREEVAQAVEAAARATGNPEIARLAQEKRQLADFETEARKRQLASTAPPPPEASLLETAPPTEPIAAKPLDPPTAIAVAYRADPTPLDAEEERMIAAGGKAPKPTRRRGEPRPSEFQVHLGSFADAEAAKSAWDALRRRPELSGLSGEVLRIASAAPGGALYRVVAGAWREAGDATAKCLSLRQAGARCEAVVFKEEALARRNSAAR